MMDAGDFYAARIEAVEDVEVLLKSDSGWIERYYQTGRARKDVAIGLSQLSTMREPGRGFSGCTGSFLSKSLM
jgi:hypothetical protein